MSNDKLYIKFVEADVTGIITLYRETAPETCAAIWGALETPMTVPASHAIFSGPEIMMGLPKEKQTFDPLAIPEENRTIIPEAGELLWFYQPKNYFKIDPDEFWEIGMFYAHGGRTFGPTGWIPCNYFGKVTENLEAIAEQCALIRKEGIKTIEFGRYE